MLDQVVAQVLRDARKEEHLSQEALALAAGLHRTYISQLERGLKSPSLRTLHGLCGVLGLSLADFASRVEDELA